MKKFKSAGLTLLLVTAGLFATTVNAEPRVVPVVDVQPEYPMSALHRDISSGYVTVRFDVDKNGRPRNIDVIDAAPDKTFRAAALNALRRSSFQVVNEDGAARDVAAQNVERTYRFDRVDSDERTVGMN